MEREVKSGWFGGWLLVGRLRLMEEVGGDDDVGGGRSGFDGGVEVDGEFVGKVR